MAHLGAETPATRGRGGARPSMCCSFRCSAWIRSAALDSSPCRRPPPHPPTPPRRRPPLRFPPWPSPPPVGRAGRPVAAADVRGRAFRPRRARAKFEGGCGLGGRARAPVAVAAVAAVGGVPVPAPAPPPWPLRPSAGGGRAGSRRSRWRATSVSRGPGGVRPPAGGGLRSGQGGGGWGGCPCASEPARSRGNLPWG